MALSNWDTIAWDEKGEPIIGLMECPDGSAVEIYKNWAYIKDSKAFRTEGSPFVDDLHVIIKFWNGNLQYRWLYLFGKRGQQNSIFLVAVYREYEPDITKELFGISCYGYKGENWVGVMPQTMESYMKWLGTVIEKEPNGYLIKLPNFKPGLRYNQGDAFFSGRLGFEIPATPIGEAQASILSQILGKLDREENKR